MSFKIEAFQNRYLAPGQGRIDAILNVTAAGDRAARGTGGPLVVGFIIDTSGSMQGERIESVKTAVARAIQLLDASTTFFVVTFNVMGFVAVPPALATPQAKRQAAHQLRVLNPDGGTAMSTGLDAALWLFQRGPDAIRQAIFLTDGNNQSEAPDAVAAALARCDGVFECDCWGVGTDWRVGEVQTIAQRLLGKASLIPEAAGIEAAFRAAIDKASGKAFKDVRLRLWTPVGAQVAFVKQVNPTIEELTGRAKVISPQVREYLTGAWGAGEARDFHVAVEVKPGAPGAEMLAARPSIVFLGTAAGGGWVEQEEKPAEGRLFASWTPDDSLSSRIDRQVAHYTGQGELAEAIQEGLELREKGNEAAATQLLGKAVKIAHASGNVDMTQRLAKVVDVVDASSGTVRLKRNVQKAAAMDLQLESRTTKRASKKAEGV